MGWPEYPTDCVTSAVDAMNPIGPAALLTIHTGSVPSTRLIIRLLDVSGKIVDLPLDLGTGCIGRKPGFEIQEGDDNKQCGHKFSGGATRQVLTVDENG